MPFQSFDTSLESRPIRDIAYEQLKHAIITGQIPAGSRIVETLYAEQLHISRTPLREALRRLERDGLVEYVLHRGVVVCAFTIEDIDEIFTIRNAMMMLILPSIVENTDGEKIKLLRDILTQMDGEYERADADALAISNRTFHGTMEHFSNKIRILRVIDSQEEYIKRFQATTIASVVRRTNAHQEHHDMVDLLEKRDLEGLKSLFHHHFEESKETCLNAVRTKKLIELHDA